jgi:hypothetical protein
MARCSVPERSSTLLVGKTLNAFSTPDFMILKAGWIERVKLGIS